MEVEAPDAPHASEHRIADAPGAREGHEEDDEEDARGDGRPFEIRDLARLRGHGFRGDVVAREAADAAGHEVDQAESVPESRHARGEGEAGGSDAEADHVRERVQLAAQRRGAVAPPRDAPVHHVEDQGGGHECSRGVELAHSGLAYVVHGQEQGRGPAAAVGEREQIREMKIADHREMLHCRALFNAENGEGTERTRRRTIDLSPAISLSFSVPSALNVRF